MIQERLAETFKGIEDPRSRRNQKHPMLSLLGIGLLGGLGGIDSFSGLADYAQAHEESLKELFDLPEGVPSHDTFGRLFDGIKPEQFSKQFQVFTDRLAEAVEGLVAIDGKTIRHSGKGNPLHIVSAWSEANQLVLGQIRVADKSNEITAIPLLLELLDLAGKTVTIDAMGCQREIAQQIIEQGGDYVLALKGNQKTLLEDVKAYFEQKNNYASWQELDKGHGRYEERRCTATDDIAWLRQEHEWPGLHSIAQVISKREIKGKKSQDVRYYLSSLPAKPELICQAARAHWSIENKLHWRLDVLYNEDGCCIRNDNAAENMAILRKWSMNILNKHKGKSSMKSLQRKASMSFNFMSDLLLKTFHA